MCYIKAMGVGLCVMLMAPVIAYAQFTPSPPQTSQPTYTPDPLEFVVRNASQILSISEDRIQVQMSYAREKGYVQYSLGTDRRQHDVFLHRLTQTYGLPYLTPNGLYEWQVQNPDPYSSHAKILMINLGAKIQQGYFIKVDGRTNRQIINQDVTGKKTPLTAGTPSQKVPVIRGRVDDPQSPAKRNADPESMSFKGHK